MNCEHGDETGLNGACEECLNEVLAKEFESGRKAGRKMAFQEVLNLLREKVGELFLNHKDDEARATRALADAVAKLAEKQK